MKTIKYTTIALVLTLVCGTNATNAQDTIFDREITYLYPDNWDDNYRLAPFLTYNNYGGGHMAEYFYTDTPLSIIGIATSSKCHFDEECSATLGLWKHHSSGMTLLAEGDIDPAIANRYMRIPHSYHPFSPNTIYFPIQETRFDSAIMVQDSFYVSFKPSTLADESYVATCEPLCWRLSLDNTNGVPGINGIDWTFVVGDVENEVFLYAYPLLWPIIDTTGWNYIPPCDTMTCADLVDFHVLPQWGNYATLSWVGAPEHTEWELSYGPVGTAPGSGRVISTSFTYATVSNMDTGVHYVAYIRGFCPECKVWSEWSEGVEFWIGMDDPPESVATVERLTYVAPNPAHGEVQVFSSYGLRRVELYNAQGQRVSTQQVSGYSTVVDVGALAAGLYFINVHTPAGVVTKKLVVE